MAGVQAYVFSTRQQKSSQTPPPAIHTLPQFVRLDHESAQQLKVLTTKPNANSVKTTQLLPSSNVGWNSNALAGRNSYSNPQLIKQHPVLGHRGGFDDTTVTSGFDDTKSDVQFDDERPGIRDRQLDEDDFDFRDEDEDEEQNDRLAQNDNSYDPQLNDVESTHVTQHVRQPKPSKSTIYASLDSYKARQGYQTPNIAGRFYEPPNQQLPLQQAKLEFRPTPNGRDMNHQRRGSRKRSRSREPVYEAENLDMYIKQQDMTHGEFEAEVGCPPDAVSGGRGQEQDDGHSRFNPSSYEGESGTSAEAEERLKPDYDDEKLTCMTYADLIKETWETENHGQKLATRDGLQEAETTLESRIEHIVMHGEPEAQVGFFGQMSITEWEQSGDYFVDRFGDLMKKIKQARRRKRELATSFEDEIEEQEQAVRGKSENLEKEFMDMRAGGEGVLKGKMI